MKIKKILFDKKLISIAAVFIILLGLLFSLYFLFYNKKTQPTNQTYKGSTFEINVPAGWSVATSSIYKDFTVISENKKLKASRDVFNADEPIIVVVSKEAGTTTLEEYVDGMKYNFVTISQRPYVKNYKLIETNLFNFGQEKRYLVKNSFDLEDQDTALKIEDLKISTSTFNLNTQKKLNSYQSISMVLIKNNKLYTVTVMAPLKDWPGLQNKSMSILLNFNPI